MNTNPSSSTRPARPRPFPGPTAPPAPSFAASACPPAGWTPAGPGCGCGPCTSWATARPASPALSAPARRPSRSSSAATPAPSARSCATPSPTCTTRGGTSAPPNAPAPNAAPPPSPAAAPSPGTGAPPPPWTTTSSTSPATGPSTAGNPPPAPAPPPTSARPPATTKEEGRMTDHRIGLDLFTDVLDVLDRHGFARGDDEHAGRAIFLISDLARIYEGTQDHPFGPSINQAPSPPAAPEPPGPGQPGRGHRPGQRAEDRPDRAGYGRRLEARPRRDVRLLPGPVLPRLPAPPPGRPGLRPAGRRSS